MYYETRLVRFQLSAIVFLRSQYDFTNKIKSGKN